MLCKVLKPFAYFPDGIHGEDLAVGQVKDIRDDLVPGLVIERFVAADGVVAPAPPPVVATVDPTAQTSGQQGAAAAPASTATDTFDAMDDKALRAFIKARDGKSPNNFVKRPELLELARKPA